MAAASNWVVEHFDVIEKVLACQFSRVVDFAFNAFAFKQLEKAVSNSTVVTVASPAHARL